MTCRRIVLLAGEGATTPIAYNFLKTHFGLVKTVIEGSGSRREFLKRRTKRLGVFTVAGQILFQLLVASILCKTSRKRVAEIIKGYNLSERPIPGEERYSVSSVNSDECLRLLQQLKPDVVVVFGTRILSKKILQGINAPFINIHAGITPRYRGCHGAYWALVNGDGEHCGVTVHMVDAGIDTGSILAQETVPVTAKDNFATYPYLQIAIGLNLLRNAIQGIERGEGPVIENGLNSALWFHPTLWGYLWNRVCAGVK